MAYLNDPRENRISPDGKLWESDGRVEDRYLWNGAYLDLCDLPVSEYMKTIFVTKPSEGGGEPTPPPTPGKPEVILYLHEEKQDIEPGKYKMIYWFTSSSNVKMDVKPTAVVLTQAGEQRLNFLIPTGQNITTQKEEIFFNDGDMKPRQEAIEIEETTGPDETYVPDEILKLPYAYHKCDLTHEQMLQISNPEDLLNFVVDVDNPINMETETKTEKFEIKILRQEVDLNNLTEEERKNELLMHSTDLSFISDKEASYITMGGQRIDDLKHVTGVYQGTGTTYHIYTLSRNDGTLYGSFDEPEESLILEIEIFYK